MEKIITPKEGTGIKLNVYMAPMGDVHLADCDFVCTFYTSSKVKTIEKSKSEMLFVDDDNYIATIDTSILGAGCIKVLLTVHVPDNDFENGYRVEIAEFVTNEVVYP